MNRGIAICICAPVLLFSSAAAQTSQGDLPSHLTIARHTFFDFGPPSSDDSHDVQCRGADWVGALAPLGTSWSGLMRRLDHERV
jgi:hypothetical protein